MLAAEGKPENAASTCFDLDRKRIAIMRLTRLTTGIGLRMIPLAILLLAAGCATSPPTTGVPLAGEAEAGLAPGELPVPGDARMRAYLGIETGRTFRLGDIPTDILLVEVFDMYCPHCQREAPNVNRLYHRIAADPSPEVRITLIGIGIGNTAYEVGLFGKTFDVPFPLLPDRSRHYVHYLDVRQTPTFVGFVRETDGTLRRILHAPGPLGEVELFLEHLLQLADLPHRRAPSNR